MKKSYIYVLYFVCVLLSIPMTYLLAELTLSIDLIFLSPSCDENTCHCLDEPSFAHFMIAIGLVSLIALKMKYLLGTLGKFGEAAR